MQETKNIAGTEPVHFDKLTPTKPLPQPPKILEQKNSVQAHIPKQNINKVPEKKNIFLIFILSTITLGIYPAIWYMTKVKEFNNLQTNKKLKETFPTILLIINIILIASIIIFPLTITQNMGTFYQHLSSFQTILIFIIILFTILKIFLTLLIAFYARTIINQALENKNSYSKVSALFTLFFTHYYLQYEINKIIDDIEEKPKVGPWVFFSILILLVLVGIVFSVL